MEEHAKVREKLRSGEYILKRKDSQAAKSDVWEKFCEVVSKDDNSSIGYVKCDSCDKLYKHDSHSSGTSNLKRHVCVGTVGSKKDSTQTDITGYIKNTKVPAKAKSEVTDGCVKLCCEDLRPFDIVSGDGFTGVAQILINIGAQYGRVDASSVLPHRQTVCDRAKGTAKTEKEILSTEVNKALECGIAITTDMWTDDFNKRAYSAFTCHYINEDWKLKSRVITTAEFDSTLKKTAVNLNDQITKELHEFGIDACHLSKVMFVSDQGSNIKAALRSYKWTPCAAHILNIVLKHTFDVKKDGTPEYMQDVGDVIDKCKSLVTYLKKSGAVVNLDYAVVQECETRWNSKVAMMQSVIKQYRDIQAAMEEKGQEERLDGIDLDVLNTVTQFLLLFKDASDELEGEKYPTIQQVILWFFKLKKHCEPHYGDPEYMVFIRARALKYLQEKLSLTITHKLGTFLNPRFKSLKMFTADERNAVYDQAKLLVKEFDRATPTPAVQSGDPNEVTVRVRGKPNFIIALFIIQWLN